jgi:N-carbamoyl-L-amino-acid hydrolase
MLSTRPSVDGNRLQQTLEQLTIYSDTPAPAMTRVLFSPVDLAARQYVRGLCEAAGLRVRTDAVGNLFARWEGEKPELAAVAVGSHIDAIPHSGRFDGTVGVLGALEAIRALQAMGTRPQRSIELLIFTAEEPTRFGIGCLGSRALAGVLGPADLRALHDDTGQGFNAVRLAAGMTGDLQDVQLPYAHYHAFIELHIEQGPLLDRQGIPIGVVTAIAAPATLHLTVEGVGGHAGTVLMPDRRDALVAAAAMVLAVEQIAVTSPSLDAVATVGRLHVFPGAVNSIPSRVQFHVDVRDIDGRSRDAMLDIISQRVQEIATQRGVEVHTTLVNHDPPATCAPELIQVVEQAAANLGLPVQRMISRAYHDALFMATLCPTVMVFIPCRDGISHRPEEYASPEAILQGIEVLAGVLQHLAW